MLSFTDGTANRRSFLKVGGLSLGGLTLPQLLAAKSQAATTAKSATGKSVVFLFMHGGPSQTETFDPKVTAPSGVRSATGELETAIPGITFGGTFPKLASMADKVSVVRSFVTGDGTHDIKPIVGRDTLKANLGSIYSRVVGANHPVTGIPTNALLLPQAVDDKAMPGVTQFGNFSSTGALGSSFAPFDPSGGGDLKKDMELRLPMDRLGDRRGLLTGLDRLKRTFETSSVTGMNRLRDQAFTTILGGVADAFDLSQEDPLTLARYDTAPLIRADHIDKKWNNHKRYVDNVSSLGKLMLLARRLCERGSGFVTVTTNFVWDMHADQNNAGVEEGMRYMGVPFDHAVSAFIEDLENRGLTDDILLVCCGEMGRTPKINANGGRNHWGNIAPLLLHGGGLNMGQVIGQSTRDVGEPLSEPFYIRNLLATIMHTLFDVGQLRLEPSVPADIIRNIESWKPIDGLV